MSDEEQQQLAAKPKRRQWTNMKTRLEPQQAQRQGAAALHAWKAFEDRDRAKDFMNGHHAALGGRPIDIAIESADGLAAVVAAIDLSARAPADAILQAGAAHGPLSPTD